MRSVRQAMGVFVAEEWSTKKKWRFSSMLQGDRLLQGGGSNDQTSFLDV